VETEITIKIIQKRSPGRETKIGLIAPGGGKVNEEEFPLLSPPHISFVIAALGMGNHRIDRVVAPPLIENAAETLASAGAEMILMCGIPVLFFQPPEYEQEIISRIKKASHLQAATMAGAVVESLNRLNIKHPAVVSHYNEKLNEGFKNFLSDRGIEVANIQGASSDHDGKVSYLDLARRAFFESPGSDGIFLSGGGTFRTIDVVAPLENELGVPVTSGGLAAIWKSLHMVGYQDPIAGYGKLLTLPRFS
jgi:maleate isomerase